MSTGTKGRKAPRPSTPKDIKSESDARRWWRERSMHFENLSLLTSKKLEEMTNLVLLRENQLREALSLVRGYGPNFKDPSEETSMLVKFMETSECSEDIACLWKYWKNRCLASEIKIAQNITSSKRPESGEISRTQYIIGVLNQTTALLKEQSATHLINAGENQDVNQDWKSKYLSLKSRYDDLEVQLQLNRNEGIEMYRQLQESINERSELKKQVEESTSQIKQYKCLNPVRENPLQQKLDATEKIVVALKELSSFKNKSTKTLEYERDSANMKNKALMEQNAQLNKALQVQSAILFEKIDRLNNLIQNKPIEIANYTCNTLDNIERSVQSLRRYFTQVKPLPSKEMDRKKYSWPLPLGDQVTLLRSKIEEGIKFSKQRLEDKIATKIKSRITVDYYEQFVLFFQFLDDLLQHLYDAEAHSQESMKCTKNNAPHLLRIYAIMVSIALQVLYAASEADLACRNADFYENEKNIDAIRFKQILGMKEVMDDLHQTSSETIKVLALKNDELKKTCEVLSRELTKFQEKENKTIIF
jgi:hypothetical protein